MMVPYVDLLNHGSRETEVQCEWSCVWDLGGGGDRGQNHAGRPAGRGARHELRREDDRFFLFFGFLPEPNPHNGVALFRGLEEAAAWYEALCGGGEETRSAWATARREAVATVCAETESPGAAAASAATSETSWSSTDAEAEEAALASRRGGGQRLLRLFEILSETRTSPSRPCVRAQRLLGDMRDAEARRRGSAASRGGRRAEALESAAGAGRDAAP